MVLPFYSGLQIGLVRPFVSPDFALRLQPDGSIYVYYKNYYQKPAVEREATSFSGLGLMTALFLATPIPWRRRLAPLASWGLLGFLRREIAAQYAHSEEKGGGSYASV